MLKFLSGLLEYSGPLLIREIINYSTEDERDLTKGILLVLGIILSRVFLALLNAKSEINLVELYLSSCA